jgi:hypothetical protein
MGLGAAAAAGAFLLLRALHLRRQAASIESGRTKYRSGVLEA